MSAPRLRQNERAAVTVAGDEVFVVMPGDEDVFYLDPVGSGLWRFLAEPRTAAEVEATLAAAFPDEPPERVLADLRRALAEMVERGLLVSVP